MKKSALIARCLVESNAVRTIEEGENIVERLFGTEFSILDYADWNQEISEEQANQFNCRKGEGPTLYIRQMIEDLM
jgi:hypothetical protein